MNTNEVYSRLRDPTIFNYDPYSSETLIEDEFLLNTIELFSLGDIKHYMRYKEKFIELDELCIDKLLKLTLLSILGQNIGNRLSLNDVLEDLVLIKQQESLEDLLISMVVSNLISVKIDQNTKSLLVEDVFVLRDAYNEDRCKLRVLTEADVQPRSVKWARLILEAWRTQKIKPNQEQLLQKPKNF